MSRRARIERTFRHTVPAPAADVFPLLCPVREYEWIPSWSCEMIYTKSGVAELDCVFRTAIGGNDAIWSVSRYEPEAGRIEFVIHAASHVQRLAVQLRELGEAETELCWTRVYTGLSEEGDRVTGELSRRFEEQYAAMAELLKGHLS